MKILSVNVGLPKEVTWQGKLVTTGIFKKPVDGPVMMRTLNLTGDQQADLTVKGGVLKEVNTYQSQRFLFCRGARGVGKRRRCDRTNRARTRRNQRGRHYPPLRF